MVKQIEQVSGWVGVDTSVLLQCYDQYAYQTSKWRCPIGSQAYEFIIQEGAGIGDAIKSHSFQLIDFPGMNEFPKETLQIKKPREGMCQGVGEDGADSKSLKVQCLVAEKGLQSQRTLKKKSVLGQRKKSTTTDATKCKRSNK